MSIQEVKVPQLSESVAEATLLEWKKKPGDAVKADEILIEIETDKVVLEVPAPASGVLTEILRTDGSTVASGELIAQWTEPGPHRQPLRVSSWRPCQRRRLGGCHASCQAHGGDRHQPDIWHRQRWAHHQG